MKYRKSYGGFHAAALLLMSRHQSLCPHHPIERIEERYKEETKRQTRTTTCRDPNWNARNGREIDRRRYRETEKETHRQIQGEGQTEGERTGIETDSKAETKGDRSIQWQRDRDKGFVHFFAFVEFG